jgi:hypothetical protein
LPSVTALKQILDMDQIRKVFYEPTLKWTSETKNEDLVDRYFVDPMNGGRRYYSDASHLISSLKILFLSIYLSRTTSSWIPYWTTVIANG